MKSRFRQGTQGFTVVEALLIIVIIAVLGGLGFIAWKQLHTTTPAAQSASTAASANQWTGGAGTYDWADTRNWSLGKPTDGQDLTIDLAKVKQPSDGTNFFFNNDLTTTVGHLHVTGNVPSAIAGIKGNPLKIKGGITVDPVQTNANSAIIQVSVNTDVIFLADQKVEVSAKNGYFTMATYKDGDESYVGTVDTDGHGITFVASNGASIDMYNALKGSGPITVNGGFAARVASPNYSGNVTVASGQVAMTEEGALGSGTITVTKGSTLSPCKYKQQTFLVTNPLVLAGSGIASTKAFPDDPEPANAVVGAIAADCGSLKDLTLGGEVTLSGDAQIGGLSSNNITYPTTFTFTKPLVKYGHTLTAVPNTQTVIVAR